MTEEECRERIDAACADLLEALEQDVIAELKYQYGGDSGHEWDKTYGWNKAMEWVINRLQIYREE